MKTKTKRNRFPPLSALAYLAAFIIITVADHDKPATVAMVALLMILWTCLMTLWVIWFFELDKPAEEEEPPNE